MSSLKKRAYCSPFRKAQAAQTRSAILESAKTLFQAKGIEVITIENIAKTANVSTPTIYALFQSKKGILRAIMDEALPVEQFDALAAEVRKEKSPKERLLIAAKMARQIYDAEREQMDIFRGASVLSPDLKELEAEREKRRYKRQEATMRETSRKRLLNKKLTLAKARDILWALTGRDLYRLLVIERGWSSVEYEAWLGKLLADILT
jgi:AcrR family transcriptional regulator